MEKKQTDRGEREVAKDAQRKTWEEFGQNINA